MANNDRCPLCGKETKENEAYCYDCQEIARTSFSEELISGERTSSNTNQETENKKEIIIINNEPNDISNNEHISNETECIYPVKKRGKSIFFIILGFILMLSLGAAGSYFFLENKHAKEAETIYWNQRLGENTSSGYMEYLIQYPKGEYIVQAENKITELQNKEQEEWNTSLSTNSIDALSAFIANHPESPYIQNAQQMIDSLGWKKTISENTTDAYKTYLEGVKTDRYIGKYEDLAQQRYDSLSQIRLIDGNELEDVKKMLNDFFESLSLAKYSRIEKLLSPQVENFYTFENISNNAIANKINADYKAKKIKTVSYTPATDSLKITKNEKDFYFISLLVTSEITYTDKKKKKEKERYIANIELDNRKLIRSITKSDTK